MAKMTFANTDRRFSSFTQSSLHLHCCWIAKKFHVSYAKEMQSYYIKLMRKYHSLIMSAEVTEQRIQTHSIF